MNIPTLKAMRVLRRIGLAAAATAVFGAAPVWATPVNTWSFDVASMFSSATNTNGNPINPTNGNTKLSWGNPSNSQHKKSSLVIDPFDVTGSVNTYFGGGTPPSAFIAHATTLTHNNFVINGASLKTAVLTNTVSLTPAGLTNQDFSFNIVFKETTNQPSGQCAVGNKPCPDIFVLDESSFNQPFSYDGDNYFLSFFALDMNGLLGSLPNGACAAAGASNGCRGFITRENASTPMQLGLAITSRRIGVEVPEPGSLLLMGAGLLGIGFAVRRRRLSLRR